MVVLINWAPSMSVSVDLIDEQHKKLVGMINDLYESMKIGEGKTKSGAILDEMSKYAKLHFATEEKYFRLYNYDETESHIAAHKAFIQKTKDFQEKYKKGEVGLSIELMNFLKDWLLGHIQKVDKRYSECFNEHGLK